LSHHLNDPIYSEKVNHIIKHLDTMDPPSGLYPMIFNITSGQISGYFGLTFTTGSSADSFYEYLVKYWLQTNRKKKEMRRLYDEAVEGIVTHLVAQSHPSKSFYVRQYQQGKPIEKMDHLSCFLPGMLALGAYGENYSRDLKLAEELLETCISLYTCQWTGLAPEVVEFVSGIDFVVSDSRYLLRPETIESLFVLYRITKKSTYRDVAWRIYISIVKYCKTESGFSGLLDVGLEESPKDDIMQGFFLSETLKYLYLIFSSEEILPLSEFVFNTEAHPLRIFRK